MDSGNRIDYYRLLRIAVGYDANVTRLRSMNKAGRHPPDVLGELATSYIISQGDYGTLKAV